MYDLVTMGEILIDFAPDGTDDRGYARYIQNPGGAVANLAAVLGKYGARTALVGKVGPDAFGTYLKRFFAGLGVDTDGILTDPDRGTTLAFVSLGEDGERDFSFYRRHEADLKLTKDELPRHMLENTRIFHFGSLSMCAEPAREATWAALDMAKKAGAVISYDPNYRASLWAGEDHLYYMRAVLDRADLVKVSEEEGGMITGHTDPLKIAEGIRAYGCKLVCVTLGANGSCFASPYGCGYVEPYKVKAVDTTGAGDVYWGTMLYEYLQDPFDSAEKIRLAAERASKAAALCTTQKGGASSIPEYRDIIR